MDGLLQVDVKRVGRRRSPSGGSPPPIPPLPDLPGRMIDACHAPEWRHGHPTADERDGNAPSPGRECHPMNDPVTFETGEECCTITFDDGQANAMSLEMLEAIDSALDRAEAEAQPLVLAGREGTFSGGFDLATLEAGGEAPLDMLQAGAELAERVLSFPSPVVVACTGHAVAMGLFLMLAGDERIGAAGEYTLQANEVEIGLTVPRFATELCRLRLTPAEFQRATSLAQPYAPAEADRAGILDEVVPPGEVLDRARESAASFDRLDSDAHKATKQRVRADALERLRAGIEADVEEWHEEFSSG